MSTLIIGADSFLGGYLFEKFQQLNISVWGTSRRSDQLAANIVKLDFKDPDKISLDQLLQSQEIKSAIFCAGISNIDQCWNEREESFRVNIRGMKVVLQALKVRNVFPIFFSSDYVFDGKLGGYLENDFRTPKTEYGRQKKIIEDHIVDQFEKFLILRTSKLFSMTMTSFKNPLWAIFEQLKQGEPMKSATDLLMTPVFIEDVAKILVHPMDDALNGLYHLATSKVISRFELVYWIAEGAKLNTSLVVPCLLRDLNFKELRSQNSVLDSSKIRSALPHLKVTEIFEGLTALLRKNELTQPDCC